MRIVLFLLVINFFQAARAENCPEVPGYYTPQVCQNVKDNPSSYKLSLLRIHLRVAANERKQPMELSEYCQYKLSFEVCGNKFVAQVFSEAVIKSNDEEYQRLLLKNSRQYLNKNAAWIKKLISQPSFSGEDETKRFLYANNLLPDGTNITVFADNFMDPNLVPDELKEKVSERKKIENSFLATEALLERSWDEWHELFKKFPEMEKNLRKEIRFLPTKELEWQNQRLNLMLLSHEKRPLEQVRLLHKTMESYGASGIWTRVIEDQFRSVRRGAGIISNTELIQMLEHMIKHKSKKDFPASLFWELIDEIKDETLLAEEKERLMLLLFQMDDEAWARKAVAQISGLESFLQEKMQGGCSIPADDLRRYFKDAYQKYRESLSVNVLKTIQEKRPSVAEIHALLTNDFNPLVRHEGKNFLDLLAEKPLANQPSEELLSLLKKVCQKVHCSPALPLDSPGPVMTSVKLGHPESLKAFLDYLRFARRGFMKDDRNELLELNKDHLNSKEIKHILRDAHWN